MNGRLVFLQSLFVSVSSIYFLVNSNVDLLWLIIAICPLLGFKIWMQQIRIDELRHAGNFAGEEFNEKYADLWEIARKNDGSF